MKLSIQAYSQRDPRWASIMLGYNSPGSSFTIGMYGCLITCYAMYLTSIGKNKNPEDVNTDLKAGNGFVSGSGLLVWSAIPRIYNLQEHYVSPKYTGPVTTYGLNKMRELLDQKRPLVCHIDFDPKDPDDDMHWVLVHGYEGDDFYCVDPWTGQYISLDVYGGAERAVIEFRAYDAQVTDQESTVEQELTKCRVSRDSHWNDLMAIKDELTVTGEYSLSNIITRIQALETQEVQVGEKDKQLRDAQNEIQKLKEDLALAKKKNDEVLEQLAQTETNLKIQQAQYGALEERLKQLEQSTQPIPKDSAKLFVLFIKSLFGRG